ncbi:MAG: hypothetical protein IJ740_06440, partial [Ruminococcus sp.]|nr:hypothetical protein [Ruminococcus sp.]
KTEFKPEPMPDRNCISDMLIKWACGSLVITIAVISGFKLAAAPPLLVAFTEFWKSGSKAQHKPIIIILLITVCAFIGSLTRYAAIIFGFYCFISAGIAITVVLLIMKKTMLIIPPAAALSILAYLIPEQQLVVYPILVMIGISMFTGISVIHGKLLVEKQN